MSEVHWARIIFFSLLLGIAILVGLNLGDKYCKNSIQQCAAHSTCKGNVSCIQSLCSGNMCTNVSTTQEGLVTWWNDFTRGLAESVGWAQQETKPCELIHNCDEIKPADKNLGVSV